jgi:septal ring factor EnvC (AmiA/AmiB activator)
LLLALAVAEPVCAKPKKTTTAPANPAPSAAQVKELEKQAAESRARAAALAERTAKMEKELAARRKSLTDTAAQVRVGEATLSKLETEQNTLADSVDRETSALNADKARLADLTAGLVRLARIPPGGLLIAFDAPVDAARAEILLRSALNATNDAARRTEREIAQLNETDRQLEAKRRETEHQAGQLKSRQADLAALIGKREADYQQTESDRKAEEERARQIAEQAKDLRDLVARIEAQRKAEAEAARRKARQQKKAVPAVMTGHYTAAAGLPVNGQVKIRFGQNDGLGTTSHGVTIIARPGATVTAPATGTVRFAGPFRGYREILILEHPGGYLSLIAGMSRVNAAVGAQVTAGEPIGTMDDRGGASPELYYELRRNGQFIDPEASAPPGGMKGKVR